MRRWERIYFLFAFMAVASTITRAFRQLQQTGIQRRSRAGKPRLQTRLVFPRTGLVRFLRHRSRQGLMDDSFMVNPMKLLSVPDCLQACLLLVAEIILWGDSRSLRKLFTAAYAFQPEYALTGGRTWKASTRPLHFQA